jgi:hypothetical protein
LRRAPVELAVQFAGDDETVTRAKALRDRLKELAEDDAAAYTACMDT